MTVCKWAWNLSSQWI